MILTRIIDKGALWRLAVPAALVCAALVLPDPAHAQEEAAAAPEMLSQLNANILWTLLAGVLVFFMQAGFACVEAGFTRAKSAGNIIMKNFLDFGVGQILFLFIGFGLMFGKDIAGFIGSGGFGLDLVLDYENFDTSGWDITFWFFQSVFAGTAATIVSGGMAERTKFSSYILVSALVTAVIYPISGHWAWGSLVGEESGGWLGNMGFLDFAGSTVVHSCGGWIALAGALVLGPRLGKYGPGGEARAIPGHNIPLGALGVFILWFGWFGFNPGSTTAVNNTIGLIAANTSLAACGGILGALSTSWFRYGKPDMSMTMNGCLAGLVAITAPCYNVSPTASVIIGLVGGVLVVLSIEFIDKILKIDDPVGAVSVHGVCGAWGTLSAGLFAMPGLSGGTAGLFYGGGLEQLGVQAIGVAAMFVWAFGMGLILMFLIKALFGLRVHEEEEIKGLDITEHGSEAYAGFQIFRTE